MKSGAFIIHVETAHSRRENVKQLTSNCPIQARIHPAVDGSSLAVHEIDRVYKRNLHKPTYPFALNAGEIGCFLSYRSVWKRMLDEKLDAALIIEDDIQINTDIFNSAFSLVKKYIIKLGYIKFPIKHRKCNYRSIDCNNNIMLCEQEIIPLGTHCQLVSVGAAINMLDKTECFDRPVDTFQQLRHITNQRIYTVFPNGVTDKSNQLSGSMIHKSKNSISVLTREWRRFKYRSNLKQSSVNSFSNKN